MSTVRATNFQNAGSANVNMTLDTSGNAIFAGMVDPGYSFMRNKIINGAMQIDQRNAGASVSGTATGVFPVDRFTLYEDTDGTMTGQRSTVAPNGFVNSLVCTTGTADTSLSATQFAGLFQLIEGVNCADLGWGSAAAQSVTLSFWVQSSLTGTFGGAVRNSASNRAYPFTYTISSANTWEQKSITIPGDTTGTWLTDTGIGVRVSWGLGVGSTYSGTAGSWSANNYLSATGAVSVIGTANATWYITGVQLESGTIATPFERRQYGQEFSLCQRYYQAGLARLRGTQASGVLESTMLFPVTMRATPTMTGTDISALSSATLLISTTLNSTGNVSWTASAEL